VAVAEAGLEVVALGPLIPGVDEDEPLLEGLVLDARDHFTESLLEGGGRGPGEHDAVLAAAGRVVP